MAVAMLSPFLLGSGLLKVDDLALSVLGYVAVSYTHLTLPTTPYV